MPPVLRVVMTTKRTVTGTPPDQIERMYLRSGFNSINITFWNSRNGLTKVKNFVLLLSGNIKNIPLINAFGYVINKG